LKVSVTLPFDRIESGEEFLSAEGIVEVAQTAERLGFYAALDTDHPVPTGRWLDAGGHYAQDPFVLLSFVAAATTKLRLQTHILVLPYRNPFITARTVSTLDVVSKGRLILGLGAGYLKGEYKALGVDFDKRNDLMDEYLKAMVTAWTHDEFTFEGTGYTALGNRILPRPVQQPHPPLYIGGNSKRAIRRAVEFGEAWNPFFTPAALATTSRTAAFTGLEDMREGLDYMHAHCEKVGRPTPPRLVLGSLNHPGEEWNPEGLLETIGRYREAGVSEIAAHMDGTTRAQWCDNAERFAADVLSRIN
jgi:probable F420-dependent oxidoreductase